MLKSIGFKTAGSVGKVEYVKCDYKKNDSPPTEGWQPLPPDTFLWGKDQHYWLKMNFKTPKALKNRHIIFTTSTGFAGESNTLNPQGMAFINGELVQALDINHTTIRLEPETDYEIYIYFYLGTKHENCNFQMWLSYIDDAAEQLCYDLEVPLNACRWVYEENSYEYAITMKALETACNMIDINYPYTDEFYEKIEKARHYLKTEYYEKVCGDTPVTVNCVGHTHIDVAWLWTLAQTREKSQRSFATVLELMKYFPEYKFMMSQPQLFKYISQDDPKMFAKIKEKIKEGRWELEGAMWLEPDCNLTSGESLVRQILHGKRYLKNEFDIDSKILFLPDVFGYSAAMPQILKKSGINHFVTSKISWNDTNTMPYDTFIWQGIDGSEIITDFITAQDYEKRDGFQNETTYVGDITPRMIAGTYKRYQQKDYNDEMLLLYGYGDGGGGPTKEMLERQRRMAYGLPGLPKTRITTLAEHFEHTEKKFNEACKQIGRVPKWVGELYLEFHRGTYTSIGKNKRFNRKSENMMQRLESLSSISNVLVDKHYAKDEFYDIWDIILLNQFHDVLPGSSVEEVYIDSQKQYEEITEKGTELMTDIIKSLSDNVKSGGGILVYNSLGFERSDVICIDGKTYETGLIPSYGYKVINPNLNKGKVMVNGNVAENDFFILEIDNFGRIVRLYDKKNSREVFVPNEYANEFRFYEDIPRDYDNWEISETYKSKYMSLSNNAEIEIVDNGCRKGFKVSHKYHDSTIEQFIYLYDSIPRVDVENEIDWHEHKQLVKLMFPFNVFATKATYDIQFGNIERNTHNNTSWDTAKFEVCGHKWVDISDFSYGVSLINDCKYGHGADGSTISLSVLKCGTWPNNVADQGKHTFKYSIYPHANDFRAGDTVKQAMSFNQPFEFTEISANSNGKLNDTFSFVNVDKSNIVIDTIKQCEDDDSIIIRMFECYNSSTDCQINFGVDIEKVEICDLMENSFSQLEVNDQSVKLHFGNFEIITLKVRVKQKH